MVGRAGNFLNPKNIEVDWSSVCKNMIKLCSECSCNKMACRIRENNENNTDDGRFSNEANGDRGAVCVHADGATSSLCDPAML